MVTRTLSFYSLAFYTLLSFLSLGFLPPNLSFSLSLLLLPFFLLPWPLLKLLRWFSSNHTNGNLTPVTSYSLWIEGKCFDQDSLGVPVEAAWDLARPLEPSRSRFHSKPDHLGAQSTLLLICLLLCPARLPLPPRLKIRWLPSCSYRLACQMLSWHFQCCSLSAITTALCALCFSFHVTSSAHTTKAEPNRRRSPGYVTEWT